MKRLFVLLAVSISVSLAAQDLRLDNRVLLTDENKLRLEEFNNEHLLDSLDQEKLPRVVSGGILGGCNMSNFIITRNHHPMSSYMRIGGELGGFLDFRLTKHFCIQPQVIFTAHQNYFEAADTTNRLWSFGVDIPIYFLGCYGSMENGYIRFGGGIFTHFTFASNISGKYGNVDAPTEETPAATPARVTPKDGYDYTRLYTLHNNHFGVCVMVGYECPFGMLVSMQYKISLSDIAGFYSEMKGTTIADALIYPQSVSLSLGYRWK